nr:hypothetical protein [Companilactobacillus kimchiensis]
MKIFIYKLGEWLRCRIRQYIWKSWKKSKARIKNLIKIGMTGGSSKYFRQYS